MTDQNNAAPDLGTSSGGRAYIAEYFATQLRRHDFAKYINSTLAADFACALAQHLSKLRAEGVHAGEPVADTVERQCPRCTGNGTILRLSGNGPDAYDVQEECSHCEGSGVVANAPVANAMPIRLSAEVLEYLKEGIENATGCEESDVDHDFANELARLMTGPLYTEPLADYREVEWGPLVVAPVAGEAQPVAWAITVPKVVSPVYWSRSEEHANEKLPDYPDGTVRRVFLDAAPQAGAEPLARYCPGCGSVGPVGDEYRDCCPDGNQARMIPACLAEKCRDTFRLAIQSLLADAAANDSAAPLASEAVRILFPVHLRKMWSGGEVQAWLDNHQGITPPTATAKGSLERYRKWQAEQTQADKDRAAVASPPETITTRKRYAP